MLKLKSIRLVLVVLFLSAAIAIAWNFVSRRPDQVPDRPAELLAPEDGKRLTKPQYQERRNGRVTFEVSADVGTESSSKIISLTNVLLKRYDEEGNATNLVTGKEAAYDTVQREIRFAGDVQLQLADGTQVFSERISADLAAQVVQITDSFRFRHGDASGSGRSLEYQIEPKQVQINGDFQLNLPGREGELSIEAADAFYDLPAYTVELTKGRVSEGQNRFAAARIDVLMTSQNRLQKLTGTGQAILQLGADRRFSGETIDAEFQPAERRLTSMTVVGQPGVNAAVYEERSARGTHRLEAAKISATPDPTTEGFHLQEFQAEKQVRLRSETLGIRDGRADRLHGVFRAGGQDLEHVHLSGGVDVTRTAPGRPGQRPLEERLTSEQLYLTFSPGQVLDHARAVERVVFVSSSTEVNRRLTAKDSLDLQYREGQVERITSRGESRVEEVGPRGKQTASAPVINAVYQGGVLRQVSGQGGVTLALEGQDGVRTSESRVLDANYSAEGVLTEVVQEGEVRIRDQRENSRFELQAERSRYEAESEVITAVGASPAILRFLSLGADGKPGRETVTTAQRIEFDRRADTLKANGSVRTLLSEGGDLIVVQAGRMEADRRSGWAVYSDQPRITQKAGSLAGRVVRYNIDDQRLMVDDKVVSTLTDQGGKKYRVVSDHLVYDREAGRARYEGSVEVTAVDFNLKAPFVELVFNEEKPNEVSEVTAWGGVEILQGENKARGQRALYYPETQKVVMTAGSDDPSRSDG